MRDVYALLLGIALFLAVINAIGHHSLSTVLAIAAFLVTFVNYVTVDDDPLPPLWFRALAPLLFFAIFLDGLLTIS